MAGEEKGRKKGKKEGERKRKKRGRKIGRETSEEEGDRLHICHLRACDIRSPGLLVLREVRYGFFGVQKQATQHVVLSDLTRVYRQSKTQLGIGNAQAQPSSRMPQIQVPGSRFRRLMTFPLAKRSGSSSGYHLSFRSTFGARCGVGLTA